MEMEECCWKGFTVVQVQVGECSGRIYTVRGSDVGVSIGEYILFGDGTCGVSEIVRVGSWGLDAW